mgnify:CR=1 FL=1
MNLRFLVVAATLMFANASADDSTLDAAIGGGIGGAAGAAIGNEVGGHDGAIIGGALGAAVGVAVTTDDEPKSNSTKVNTYYRNDKKNGTQFCPPGQAKKGRC